MKRSLSLVFLINLFRDINIIHIFYKLSQSCGTKTQNDIFFGTEGVHHIPIGHSQLEMSNGPWRASPMSCRVMPCYRLPSRYMPSCLAGHASTGFIPSLRPTSRFSCRVAHGPSNRQQLIFINIFHQMLKFLSFIFTNIIINITYIQVITTPEMLSDQPLKRAMLVPCRVLG